MSVKLFKVTMETALTAVHAVSNVNDQAGIMRGMLGEVRKALKGAPNRMLYTSGEYKAEFEPFDTAIAVEIGKRGLSDASARTTKSELRKVIACMPVVLHTPDKWLAEHVVNYKAFSRYCTLIRKHEGDGDAAREAFKPQGAAKNAGAVKSQAMRIKGLITAKGRGKAFTPEARAVAVFLADLMGVKLADAQEAFRNPALVKAAVKGI